MIVEKDEFERHARTKLGSGHQLDELLALRKQIQREGMEAWSKAKTPTAGELNAANRKMIARAASLLGPAKFERVFGFAPTEKFNLFSGRLMQPKAGLRGKKARAYNSMTMVRAVTQGPMDRAVKIVRAIFPRAKAEYVAAFEAGDAQLAAAGITTPLRLAHLLAQCGAETGGLQVTRESLMYRTEGRLQQIFNNMTLSKPLMPGEVRMLLRQEKDLGERFYGISLPSALYERNGMNGGINPGNTRKARALGNDRPGDGFLFRGNGLLQTTGGKAHREAGNQVNVDFFNHPELVTAAEHALKPVLFEWTRSRCNVFADQDDLLKISRAINLGNPNSRSTPNGMDERAAFLRKAKRALGI